MHAHQKKGKEAERNNGKVLDRRETGLIRKPAHEKNGNLRSLCWNVLFVWLVGWLCECVCIKQRREGEKPAAFPDSHPSI